MAIAIKRYGAYISTSFLCTCRLYNIGYLNCICSQSLLHGKHKTIRSLEALLTSLDKNLTSKEFKFLSVPFSTWDPLWRRENFSVDWSQYDKLRVECDVNINWKVFPDEKFLIWDFKHYSLLCLTISCGILEGQKPIQKWHDSCNNTSSFCWVVTLT